TVTKSTVDKRRHRDSSSALVAIRCIYEGFIWIRRAGKASDRRPPLLDKPARSVCLAPPAARAGAAVFHRGDKAMHIYRTHTAGELRASEVGRTARLSGWVHRKRDHGNLLFIDVRDHYGVTQCVIDTSSPLFGSVEAARLESVVTITGQVVARSPDTVNP